MSQAGVINVSGSGGGGSPVETITGNDAIAVPPTANNINLVGGSSSANNNNGIVTSGNIGTSTETISLTNRVFGSTTTSNGAGQTQTLLTLSLGSTPGVYAIELRVSGFDKTDTLGGGYAIFCTVRTTGAAGVFIGTQDIILQEEGFFQDNEVVFSISTNSFVVQVTGVSGKTADWFGLLTYIFVS